MLFFHADCGVLPPADNAEEIVYSNFQFEGSTATETCDSDNGYIQIGTDPVTNFGAATGSVVRTCTESTGWDGSAITCSRKSVAVAMQWVWLWQWL